MFARKGKHIRKCFGTKSEAQQYERWVIATQNGIKSMIPNLAKRLARHVLRYTFASHFMMNGGNMLKNESESTCF
ncbi:hypothetical protein CKY10_09350 [Photorhabdus sp. HUG-39]|nr:hypothetical protein CKY10_09350 [Photorhabdus sp. HUG-39]